MPTTKLGAHYYLWYRKGHWDRQECRQRPRIDFYDSVDRAVVEYHIALARGWGIGTFVLECVDPRNTPIDTVFFAGEANRPRNLNDLDYAVLYDVDIRLKTRAGFGEGSCHPTERWFYDFTARCGEFQELVVGQIWEEDLRVIIDKYAMNTSWPYLHVRGRPLIWLYNALWYGDGWRERMASVRRYARDHHPREPYFVADLGWVRWPEDAHGADLAAFLAPLPDGTPPFDAVSGYSAPFTSRDPRSQIEVKRANFAYVRQKAAEAGVSIDILPSAAPQFQMHEKCGEAFPPRRYAFLESRDEFREVLREVRALEPDVVDGHFFVTTFNEWHEGTTIEPTGKAPSVATKFHRRSDPDPDGSRNGLYEFELLDAIRAELGDPDAPVPLAARVVADTLGPDGVKLTAGRKHTFTITVENAGSFAWSPLAAIRLGRNDAADPENPARLSGRIELPPQSLLMRGTRVVFPVTVNPPAELRGQTLTLEMQMLMENHVRFGDVWRKRVTFV